MSKYEFEPFNLLPNGLTLLQCDPECAVQLDYTKEDHGWLYIRKSDGSDHRALTEEWEKVRQLTGWDLDMARDQAADMSVLVIEG